MRIKLKIAILKSGCKHGFLASEANKSLPADKHLSEHTVTLIVTNRKRPTPKQARAIANVLKRSVTELFPSEVAP
jgi:hypothetical protein